MSQSLRQRVVITGIGMVTPLGPDRESSWQGLEHGASATRWVQRDDSSGMAGAPAAEFADDAASFSLADADPVVRLAVRAAREALADAGLVVGEHNRDDIGCVVGTSKGGVSSFARLAREMLASDSERCNPGLWPQIFPNAAAATLSQLFDLRGPSLCPVAACATGLVSLLRGVQLIQDGHCRAVLAGSSDASLSPAIIGSFQRLGVLARGFDDPRRACKPFDRHRNGFLVGEGAAMLVLEDADHAQARGAKPYAEWVAGGVLAEHAGLVKLDDSALGLQRLIRQVLKHAELTSSEVDYVNLHGTATLQNDLCETLALKAALGPRASRVRCSSLKGGIGHLLGAAASVEMAATLLAIRDQVVPPTVNLVDRDDQCDLDYTPRRPREQRIENALKLSLGFGGHLVAAVVRAV